MQVSDPYAEIRIIFGQIFGHTLGKRCDKHPLVGIDPFSDFCKQVIHLVFSTSDLDLRIDKTGRPNDLFDNCPFSLFHFVVCGRGRNVNCL